MLTATMNPQGHLHDMNLQGSDDPSRLLALLGRANGGGGQPTPVGSMLNPAALSQSALQLAGLNYTTDNDARRAISALIMQQQNGPGDLLLAGAAAGGGMGMGMGGMGMGGGDSQLQLLQQQQQQQHQQSLQMNQHSKKDLLMKRACLAPAAPGGDDDALLALLPAAKKQRVDGASDGAGCCGNPSSDGSGSGSVGVGVGAPEIIAPDTATADATAPTTTTAPTTSAMSAPKKPNAAAVANYNPNVKIPESKVGLTYYEEADVLCGRGGGTNVHPGNKMFRDLINSHRREYLRAKKNDKPDISRSIVRTIREAGGRFLKRDDKAGVWTEIGDDGAREKTSQALRQRAPEMRRLLFRDEYNQEEINYTDAGILPPVVYHPNPAENAYLRSLSEGLFADQMREKKEQLKVMQQMSESMQMQQMQMQQQMQAQAASMQSMQNGGGVGGGGGTPAMPSSLSDLGAYKNMLLQARFGAAACGTAGIGGGANGHSANPNQQQCQPQQADPQAMFMQQGAQQWRTDALLGRGMNRFTPHGA